MSLIDGIYQEQEALKEERLYKEMTAVKSKHSVYLQQKTSEIIKVLSDRYVTSHQAYIYLIEHLQEVQNSSGQALKASIIDKTLTFGQALEALKAGKQVMRNGWNGKNMFLYLIKGTDLQKMGYGYGEYPNEPTFEDTIGMRTAKNTIVVGWLASQTDMLASDWQIL